MIRQLEAELPNDVPTLKNFTIEVVMANQLFQDRCKVSGPCAQQRTFLETFCINSCGVCLSIGNNSSID
jgi:hypothetical protein